MHHAYRSLANLEFAVDVLVNRRLLAVTLVATLALACSSPPARPVPVGRTVRSYVDSARTNWDGTGPRPIETTVWYPAAAGTPESDWAIDIFRFGRGARNAPFADQARRPLIVLSHGTGGSMAQLSWLGEALASEGFVVAGVNHHGNTAAEDRYRPAGFVLPWERALDLSVLIDRLAADSTLGIHVDTARVGAAGFSLGGYTVLALAGARLDYADWRRRCARDPSGPYCALPPEANFTLADVDALARTDPPFRSALERNARPTREGRVRAVFAMAPAGVPLLDTLSLASVSVPVRVILGGADRQVLAEPTAAALGRYVPGVSVETRAGVGHYAFLASCTWRGRLFVRALCRDGGTSRDDVHRAVAHDAVRFFQPLRAADGGRS